jgi:hypothetical protein
MCESVACWLMMLKVKQKAIFTQVAKKLPAIYEKREIITVLTRANHLR